MRKSIIFFLTIIFFLIGLIAFLVRPVEHKRVYQNFERMPLDAPPQIEITPITALPVPHSSGCSCGHDHK